MSCWSCRGPDYFEQEKCSGSKADGIISRRRGSDGGKVKSHPRKHFAKKVVGRPAKVQKAKSFWGKRKAESMVLTPKKPKKPKLMEKEKSKPKKALIQPQMMHFFKKKLKASIASPATSFSKLSLD